MPTNLNARSASIYKNCNFIYFFLIVKEIFKFLTVSSLFVAITGFFQTLAGYILLEITPNIQICIAIFLMTFSLYSLNKLTDAKEDAINMPERLNFLRGKKNFIIIFSIAAYILCIVLTFLHNPSSVVVVLVPLIANSLYGSKLFPCLPRLKDIPVMKNFIVALSWALSTTLLPAAHNMNRMSNVALVLYFMLIKAFVNTVMYDIRDVVGDRDNNIRTIPVLFGPRKTILFLLAINCTLLPLLMFLNGNARLLAAILILNSFAYIIYFVDKINPLVMDLFVDGEWMLSCIMLFLLTKVGFLG